MALARSRRWVRSPGVASAPPVAPAQARQRRAIRAKLLPVAVLIAGEMLAGAFQLRQQFLRVQHPGLPSESGKWLLVAGCAPETVFPREGFFGLIHELRPIRNHLRHMPGHGLRQRLRLFGGDVIAGAQILIATRLRPGDASADQRNDQRLEVAGNNLEGFEYSQRRANDFQRNEYPVKKPLLVLVPDGFARIPVLLVFNASLLIDAVARGGVLLAQIAHNGRNLTRLRERDAACDFADIFQAVLEPLNQQRIGGPQVERQIERTPSDGIAPAERFRRLSHGARLIPERIWVAKEAYQAHDKCN